MDNFSTLTLENLDCSRKLYFHYTSDWQRVDAKGSSRLAARNQVDGDYQGLLRKKED
jgi:hypothetical protein